MRAHWCLGTRLVVSASIAWAGFVLAHMLLAGRWWPWLIVEALPPIAFVVVPLLLLAVTPLARPVRRPMSVLLAALLLVGLGLSGLDRRVAQSPAANTIKVFSWNTDVWTLHKDRERFFAYLREQQADVYVLQEYLHWDENGAVRIDDTAELRRSFPGYHIFIEGEMLTMSRLPIIATYPRPTSDWYWQGNKAVRVDVQFGDSVLSIYNVHLFVPFRRELSPLGGAFYDFARTQYELRQAELDRLRADLAENPYPAIVLGDFNSPWFGSLMNLGPRMHRLDAPALLPTTWPVRNYPFPRLWRLDWAFTTEDVRVAGYAFRPNPGLGDHLAHELTISD
jgi:endonuclease/exonuclease/phosphatase (EEP) superfamily protein YafD